MKTMNDKPNLFNFATSELSQDAFIAWLASWADPKCSDVCPKMHQLGKEFLISLVTCLKNEKITSVEVKKQFKKIDLVIDINEKHLIVIEDKTYSRNHSNQLEKYRNLIKCEVENKQSEYHKREPHFIYFKTGDEIKRSSDTMSGFKTYRRSDFLKVLENGAKINNDILNDFTNRLRKWEDRVNAYEDEPMETWGYDQWTGFFVYLCNHINEKYGTKNNEPPANFGHINNRSGGFQGAWFGFKNLTQNLTELGGHIYFLFNAKPSKNWQFRPDLTLRISANEDTKEATKKFKDKIEANGVIDAIKENPFLKEKNILINQKGLRTGKSMRILSFEGVANSRSVDQIIEVVDSLIELRI